MNADKRDGLILFGGTFNPIHEGHLKPVLEVSETLQATELVYLPCHIPPHKKIPGVSSQHRLAMVNLAVKHMKSNLNICVSDYEIQQQGHSYTVNTVKHFKSLNPNKTIYFVIGMDSLLSFHRWFKWKEIFDYCNLVVMQRPNYQSLTELESSSPLAAFSSQICFVQSQLINVSSTEIRDSIAKGQKPELMPESIYHYAIDNKLYQ